MPTVEEGRFPLEAWRQLFPGVRYPIELPDELVRRIATLRVYLDEVPDEIVRYVANSGELGPYAGLMFINLVQSYAAGLGERIDEIVQSQVKENSQWTSEKKSRKSSSPH